VIPKPPYKAEPFDVLLVQLDPNVGIPMVPFPSGPFAVDADGTIPLPIEYGGPLRVLGMSLAEIKAAVEKQLREGPAKLRKVDGSSVTVNLGQGRAAQRINGPHLVRQDGKVSLGTYGSVHVAGLTLAEVRRAIEEHLSAYLVAPEVSVDVQGFNSKLFYVIQDGAGSGQTVTRLPVTGNDTVLDAISQLGGLSPIARQDRMWVSRPGPSGCVHQILPIDWKAITELGDTTTNYQLMPGDRLFISSYPLIRVDTTFARFFAPVERALGIILLGNSVKQNLNGLGVGGVGGR
ncbi:MAG: polysaccharide biosynthesis/export family protein, partial [Gemmataceae bacterium]|nr:polysaccharide biosynthesis/export family protein [Gemmataceae bacterium]